MQGLARGPNPLPRARFYDAAPFIRTRWMTTDGLEGNDNFYCRLKTRKDSRFGVATNNG